MNLNERAARVCRELECVGEELGVCCSQLDNGARVWDFGVQSPGGLLAGLYLARLCLSDLAEIRLVPPVDESAQTYVFVETHQPALACMASQYAGWQINPEGYFAMGSGPMRAVAAVEELFEKMGYRESAEQVVGVIETAKLPTEEVAEWIAGKCQIQPEQLVLAAAPTASVAGGLQIVARSVETALHKMLDLGYPLERVERGAGSAPLPPVAPDDLTGIGRTNDAILYGGEVTLWVSDDDAALNQLVQKIPSCASPDFGEPFRSIFKRYDQDFYKIDPHLFSPAVIRLVNTNSGNCFAAGRARPDVLQASFGAPSAS